MESLIIQYSNIDLITPMLNYLFYEGLIDEQFGINGNLEGEQYQMLQLNSEKDVLMCKVQGLQAAQLTKCLFDWRMDTKTIDYMRREILNVQEYKPIKFLNNLSKAGMVYKSDSKQLFFKQKEQLKILNVDIRFYNTDPKVPAYKYYGSLPTFGILYFKYRLVQLQQYFIKDLGSHSKIKCNQQMVFNLNLKDLLKLNVIDKQLIVIIYVLGDIIYERLVLQVCLENNLIKKQLSVQLISQMVKTHFIIKRKNLIVYIQKLLFFYIQLLQLLMQTEQFFFDSTNTNDKNNWTKLDSIKRPISTIRLFEGTLFIKSKKQENFKPKFFKLFSDRLHIYKNGREQKEIAALFLTNVYLDLRFLIESDKHKFPIVLLNGNRKVILNARSQESQIKWIEQFKKTCILNNYRDVYINIQVLGKGTFAKVLLAQKIVNKSKFAVKTFQKSALMNINNTQRQGLINEINLLRSCDHPNIIKLYEIYESGDYIYLVMELLEGGELFDLIVKTPFFLESKIALIMFKIFDALEYLHTKNIMHRDIKLENILLNDKSENFDLKIADFGLASYTESEMIIKRCGTPGYVAPEILDDQKYNEKVDVFSAGIIFYILLTGQAPFYGNSLDDVIEKNRTCQINFKDLKISQDAQDLLSRTLEPNPKNRISSLEALSHPFISRLYKRQINSMDDIPLDDLPNDNYSAFENMKKFSQNDMRFKMSKLKKNELVQQTPFMGFREYDLVKATQDSWLNEKSIDSQQTFKSPWIQQQLSDSDDSILNTPEPKKETQRYIQINTLQQTCKQSPSQSIYSPNNQQKEQIQMNFKKANQIRDQLKKLGS